MAAGRTILSREWLRWGLGLLGGLLPVVTFGAGGPPVVESQPLAHDGGSIAAPATVPAPAETRAGRESSILMEMYSQLEALQREVRELRGAIEVQEHRGTSIEQRQRELYVDIDRRLRRIEEAAKPAADHEVGEDDLLPVPVPVIAGGKLAETEASTAEGPGAERQAYERAFDMIKAGRHEEAIDAFHGFLSRFPGSSYAANAQYWVGEGNYVLRRFERAAEEFAAVLERYPDSGKAADAMLKLGFAQYEMQRFGEAAKTLQQVVDAYPSSTARQLAEGRLQRMRMEGQGG